MKLKLTLIYMSVKCSIYKKHLFKRKNLEFSVTDVAIQNYKNSHKWRVVLKIVYNNNMEQETL